MLKNPIFGREIKQAARDPKVIVLVLGFVLILSAILLFLWPSGGVFSLVSANSMQIFNIFLMSNLALVILLVPALTSPSITTERENKSFDLLFTSLLTPGEILRGKLFAGIAMVVVVALVSMPVSALCALSGGVPPSLLLRAYAVLLMAAVTYGIIGLAISALCRATFTSLMMTYVVVAALAGTTWIPYYLLGRLDKLRWLWLILRALSPFDAIYSLLYPARYDMTALAEVTSPYLPFRLHLLGMAVILVVALVFFCRYVLAPPRPGVVYYWLAGLTTIVLIASLGVQYNLYDVVLDAAAGGYGMQSGVPDWATPHIVLMACLAFDALLGIVIYEFFIMARKARDRYEQQYEDRKTARKRRLHWPFYLIDPLKRKKAIGRWRNPVFVAELRSKVFGKPKFILRGLFACIIANMVLMVVVCWQYAAQLDPEMVRVAAIIFQLGIVAVLAPAVSSGSITDEVTSHTFTMLRMTPLPAFGVVLGKLKAAFLYVSIFLVSSIPVLLALTYLDYDPGLDVGSQWGILSNVAVWVAILLMTTVVFVTAGLCASAFANSTSSATAISYAFAGTICIVTLGAAVPGAFAPGPRQAILTLNPVVAALRVQSDVLFGELSSRIVVWHLGVMAALAAGLILLTGGRVYHIFTRRA